MSSVTSPGIVHVLLNIFNELSTVCVARQLDKLELHQLMELFQFLNQHKHVLHISVEQMEMLSAAIKDKLEQHQVYVLRPTVNDLLSHNVYKLTVNNKLYLVPMWHNELCLDDNVTVVCQPRLPPHVTLCDNNELHCVLNVSAKDALEPGRDTLTVELGGRVFHISTEKLRWKREQVVTFRNQGVAKIMETDMYNIRHKANVVVHVCLHV